jgi:hypothetical protein
MVAKDCTYAFSYFIYISTHLLGIVAPNLGAGTRHACATGMLLFVSHICINMMVKGDSVGTYMKKNPPPLDDSGDVKHAQDLDLLLP